MPDGMSAGEKTGNTEGAGEVYTRLPLQLEVVRCASGHAANLGECLQNQRASVSLSRSLSPPVSRFCLSSQFYACSTAFLLPVSLLIYTAVTGATSSLYYL